MTPIERLARWLENAHPTAAASLQPGADKKAIARLSRALDDVPGAATLLDLYRWKGGQTDPLAPSLRENYTWLSIPELFEAKDMLDDMAKGGEWDDEGETWISWWVPGWVPFFERGSDLYLVDTVGSFGGKPGQILEFLHDSEDRQIVAPSFDAWLRVWVDSLEANLWTVDDTGFIDAADALDRFVAKRLPGYPRWKKAKKTRKAPTKTKPAAKKATTKTPRKRR